MKRILSLNFGSRPGLTSPSLGSSIVSTSTQPAHKMCAKQDSNARVQSKVMACSNDMSRWQLLGYILFVRAFFLCFILSPFLTISILIVCNEVGFPLPQKGGGSPMSGASQSHIPVELGSLKCKMEECQQPRDLGSGGKWKS